MTPIALHDPADIVLAAPLLLGYWPGDSVTAVLVDDDDRIVLIMRWQLGAADPAPCLPAAPDAAVACHIIATPLSGRSGGADAVRAAAALSDLVPVRWVLVAEADGHRIAWRTPDGRQCGVVGLEDVAVIARRWGIRHDWAASRADYVADIDSRPDLVAAVQEMLGARTAVEISLDDVIAHTCGWLEATHDEVPPRDPAAIAAILAALADVRVRDTVLWELMQREPWAWAHAAERLAHVVAGAPRGHAAPAACVLAVLRWQVGDGSRASAAIERALDDDPTYSLALLIDRCLGVAMHPQAWREGILAMARDDCRRSA